MVSNGRETDFAFFSDAIKLEKLDSYTYKFRLDENFCIGSGETIPTSASFSYLNTDL